MSQIVLVCASGFLATHVIDQLLDAGYRVRGTARSPKADAVREAYSAYGDKFEVAVVDDIATSDLTAALTGVTALIHVAATLSQDRSTEALLQSKVQGTRRVLDAAAAAGVKNIVVTASASALLEPGDIWKDIVIDETCWNPRTREDALQPNADRFTVFAVAKKLTEHPHHIDASRSMQNGTNRYFYRQINGFEGRPFSELAKSLSYMFPAFVHVSDAARAHVLALNPLSSSGPKRVIMNSGYILLKASVEHIAQTRPALRSRLPDMSSAPEDPETYVNFDTFKTWQETMEETIDSIIEIQKSESSSQ
ncbi:NAD(P)-binding protein [Dentipellis sp. KUC8613]|nr:NAD(P)-binding protein [Dentipellis sp. KUC8613]